MNFFLGLQQHFTLLAFGALDGIIEDALGLLFRRTDLFFGNLLAVCHANKEENNTTQHKRACDQADCQYHIHNSEPTSLLKFGMRLKGKACMYSPETNTKQF